MLLFTALLFIPDAAPTQLTPLNCAYREIPFCLYVTWAHNRNQEALTQLGENFAKNGTKRLKQADDLVVGLLQKDKLPDILAWLEKALSAELGALVRMKADCYKPVRTLEEDEKETCRTVYGDIGYAALKLVEAFVEVGTDKSKTAPIKEKLTQKFSNTESPNPSTNFTNAVYDLGREALDLMKR